MTNKWRDCIGRGRRLTTHPTGVNWVTLVNYWGDTPDFPGYLPVPYPGEPMGTEKLQEMLEEAQKYLGYSYQWGGKTPPYFDCSGFVGWCYKVVGLIPWEVDSYTGTLHDYCTEVSESEALPGDLCFWNGSNGTTWEGNAHVGIYIGNGYILDDSSGGVDYRLVTWHYQDRFAGYFRVPGAQDPDEPEEGDDK